MVCDVKKKMVGEVLAKILNLRYTLGVSVAIVPDI